MHEYDAAAAAVLVLCRVEVGWVDAKTHRRIRAQDESELSRPPGEAVVFCTCVVVWVHTAAVQQTAIVAVLFSCS